MRLQQYNQPNLLVPPREEDDVHPYRRVWPSILFEIGCVYFVTISVYILYNFLGIRIPGSLNQLANIGIAILPATLWLFSSYVRETRVLQPRERLGVVFLLSLLVANAVGIPIIRSLDSNNFLSLAGTIDRIVGYAFTVALIQEALKYLIIRYVVWPNYFRIRSDGIAYSVAVAIAYATMINLSTVDIGAISSDLFAARVLHVYTVHIIATLIVSYGLTELRFNPRSLFLLPVSFLLALLLIGLSIPVRSEFLNAGFALGQSAPRLLVALAFTTGLMIATLSAIAFIFNAAERREIEAYTGGELQ